MDGEDIKLYITSILQHSDFKYHELNYCSSNNKDLLTLLVISAHKIDFQKIKNGNKLFPVLKARKVTCEQIGESRCILIQGMKNEDELLVKLYFSNKSESGGGEIKTIEKKSFNNETLFLIEYVNENCVNEVIKRSHKEGVTVSVFYGDINDFLNLKPLISPKPAKIEIHTVKEILANDFPLSIIIKNKELEKDFVKFLSNYEIKLSTIEPNRFKLEYFASKITNEQLDAILSEFKGKFSFYEWPVEMDVLNKIRPTILAFYENSSFLNLSFPAQTESSNLAKIRIEGFTGVIEGEIKKIECLINSDNNKKIVDRVETLKQYESSLLLKCDFIKKCKAEHSDISIKIAPSSSKCVVTFDGFMQSVLNSKQKMWSFVHSIRRKDYQFNLNLSKFFNDFKEQIERCLEERNYIIEYEVNINVQDTKQFDSIDSRNGSLCEKGEMCIYGFEDAHITNAYRFFCGNYLSYELPLANESLVLLDTSYPQFIEQIRTKLNQKDVQIMFTTSKQQGKVACVGDKQLVKRFEKDINEFFEKNTVIDKTIDRYNNQDVKYLYIVKEKDLTDWCKNMTIEKSKPVQFRFENAEKGLDNIEFKLLSSKEIETQFIENCNNLLKTKIVEMYAINDKILFNLLNTERGRKRLNLLERGSKCLVKYINDSNVQTSAASAYERKNSFKNDNRAIFKCLVAKRISSTGPEICVFDGSIINFNKAQFIVAACTKDLRPFDSFWEEFYANGGDQLKKELDEIIKRKRTIFEGQSIVTKSGSLNNCKNIIHAVLPKLQGTLDRSKFKDCVWKILDLANENYSTVALPLFYADNSSLNNNIVHTVIDETLFSISNYVREVPSMNISKIYIVNNSHAKLIADAVTKMIKDNKDRIKTTKKIKLYPSIPDAELAYATGGKVGGTSTLAPIKLEIGSITDSKFVVDVIVNTTSFDLVLTNGTVSKLLLQKAGNEIQTELTKNYKGGLNKDCLVAISSAGNIKNAKYIFHIGLNQYTVSQETENQFKQIVTELLNKANENKCASIALPALGTGILQYPREKVAQWMFASVNDYFKKNPSSTIKEVLFVLFDKDTETINEFRKYEKNQQNKKNDDDDDDEGEDDNDSDGDGSNNSDNDFEYITDQQEARFDKDSDFYSNLKGNSTDGFKINFRNVQVHAFVGDITRATEDVIVCPTGSDFQLGGNVARAILAVAGNSLMQTLRRAGPMLDNGVYWTNGGDLKVKQILFLDVESAAVNESVVYSLININEKKFRTAIFPVIGTGIRGEEPKTAIEKMLEGIATFIATIEKKHQQLSIEKVNICIYTGQSSMLNLFEQQMKDLSGKKEYKPKYSWLYKAYDKVTSFINMLNPISNDRYDKKASGFSSNKRSSINYDNTGSKFEMKFELISDSKEKINETKNELNKLIGEEKESKDLTDEFFKTLDIYHKNSIEQICKDNDVDCDILKNQGKIVFNGTPLDISTCTTKINNLINESMKNEIETAHKVSKDVQWEYQINEKWTGLNVWLNHKIETAYINKKLDNLELQDNNLGELKISSAAADEFKIKINNKKFPMRRINLDSSLFSLPKEWDTNKLNDLVTVEKNSFEYKRVLDEFYKAGLKDCSSEIISIERVQNKRLYNQYMVHKKHFEERDKKNVNEKTLFHGTTGYTVDKIWNYGFNRSFAGVNATGSNCCL